MKESEKQIIKNICQYIKMQFKDCIFTVDTSGLKLTIGLATQMKQLRSDKGLPDLFIFEPRSKYHGLFIEIKIDNYNIFKKDGKTFVNDHIKEQYEILSKLRGKGYMALFGIGFDECKDIIDKYMKLC